MTERLRALAWAILLLAAGITLAVQLAPHPSRRVETNLLKLLPASEHEPAVARGLEAFASTLGRRLLFAVSSTDRPAARAAATNLAARLAASPVFTDVRLQVGEGLERPFYELYFPRRFRVVAPALLDTLAAPDGGARVAREALQALHSPLSTLYTRILEQDPLFFFPAWLENLPRPPGRAANDEGLLTVVEHGRTHVLFFAELADSPFARAFQRQAVPVLDAAEAETRRAHPGVEILSTGALRFAHRGSSDAEADLTRIGTGSALGVALLVLLAYGSLRWLGLGLLPVAAGFLLAAAGTFLVFDRVHLIALGFGASLIGVSIDYSFHYFADRLSGPFTPSESLRRILPALGLGVATSVISYVGLLAAPFPGLRQMALFSSLGLLGAFGTVVCWFPLLSGPSPRRPGPAVRAVLRLFPAWRDGLRSTPGRLALAALVLLAVGGMPRLRTDDDVRRLQAMDPELVRVQERVAALAGGLDQGRFFLVTGPTEQALLESLEALRAPLRELRARGVLEYAQNLADWVPSLRTQEATLRLVRSTVVESGLLARHLESIGAEATVQQTVAAALTPGGAPPLTVAEWVASPVSRDLRLLWLAEADGTFASIVPLAGVRDPATLRALAPTLPGVHWVDQAEDYRDILRRHRITAGKLVAAAYAVIGLGMLLRYGPRKAFWLLLPTLLAVTGCLGALGWAGNPLNLFHLIALLLVLGFGIDYSLFFAESREDGAPIAGAVVLCAASTLLSFGLLALSGTAFLRGFGLTLSVGIGLAALFSPLAAASRRSPAPSKEVP